MTDPREIRRLRLRQPEQAPTPKPDGQRPATMTAEDRAQLQTNLNVLVARYERIGAICRACQDRLKHPNISEAEAIVIEDCDFIRLSSCRRRRLIKQGKARCPLNRPIFEEQVANDETK